MKLRSERVAWQEIDGELVILDLESSRYLRTNTTGAFLTKLLKEDRQQPALVDELAGAFGIDRDTAARDVAAFTGRLRELDLLEVRLAGTGG